MDEQTFIRLYFRLRLLGWEPALAWRQAMVCQQWDRVDSEGGSR